MTNLRGVSGVGSDEVEGCADDDGIVSVLWLADACDLGSLFCVGDVDAIPPTINVQDRC